MGLTTDRRDGCLYEIDPDTGMQHCYLILPDEQRQELVHPVRTAYRHLKCGTVTRMARALGETYAAQPVGFYSGTYCVSCRGHFPVGEHGEFVWVDCDPRHDAAGEGTLVGTLNVRPAVPASA